MRIGLVGVSQETDTFNPSLTTLEHFESFGIERGAAVLERRGTSGSVYGYLDAADRRGGVETVPIFNAHAVAGGRLSAGTLTALAHEVQVGLSAAGRLDGVALLLHGACSAAGVDDVDGFLLAIARDVVGPEIPIVLALDHHANVTETMVRDATALVAHRTQPHDLTDTGRLAADLLFRIVAGEASPTVGWRKIPMITHQEQFLTRSHPMKTWFDSARVAEEMGGVLSVSTFPMQPWLDVDEAGWSVVVYTEGDPGLADRIAADLADDAWALRHDFMVGTSVPPAEAVRRACAVNGLVVLSDTGDSVLGGAGGDSTVLLDALMAGGARRALVPVVDPTIAKLVGGAPVGAVVTVEIGGRVAGMHESVTVTGTLQSFGPYVLTLDDGLVGQHVDLGATAVIAAPVGVVVVTQRPGVGGVYPEFYRQLGIDPSTFAMVVVKTASNFQHFAPIATDVVRADTPGPTQSDIAGLRWTRIPRPMFPLDALDGWRAAR